MRLWWFKRVGTHIWKLAKTVYSSTMSGIYKVRELCTPLEQVIVKLIKSLRETIMIAENIAMKIRVVARESLNLTENIVVRILQTVRRTVTEILTITENVIARVVTMLKRTVSETLSISENVNVTIYQQGTQWDSAVLYDHNDNQLSFNSAILQDNSITTYQNIYYTPPVPTNPRRFVLTWNAPVYYTMISFYVYNFTPGKSVIIRVRDTANNYEEYTVLLTAGGWYDVEVWYSNIQNISSVEFRTDSNVFGYVSISEVWLSFAY